MPGLRANKVYSQDISSVCHGTDPLLATSQHQREAKPWYVCPRYPWSDGVVFDPAPFIGTAHRRMMDNPGGLMQAGFTWGLLYGIASCYKDTTPAGEHVIMPMARNRHIRLGHEWAMKRLAFVWMLRPAFIATSLIGAYTVPKEIFQQNFGRKNKRGFFDHVPHLVGCSFLYPSAKVILGRTFARSITSPLLFFGLFYEFTHYWGHTVTNQQRELTYPIVLASLYGLPNGGNGYDGFVGGEHGKEWRLESNTEASYLSGRFPIGNSSKYDNHPIFKQEWGQTSIFS